MPNARATFFFSLGRFAWTETHWHTETNELADAIPDTYTLAKKRVALMGSMTSLDKVRLSFDGVWRDSLLVDPSGIPPPRGQLAVTTPGDPQAPKAGQLDSDEATVDVVVRMEGTDRRRKTLYLGGNPDALVTGPQNPKGIEWNLPWWHKAWLAYTKEILNKSWGFMCRTVDPQKGTVQGFQGNAVPPTQMGIIVPNGSLGPVGNNNQIQLRNFKLVFGSPAINGKYWMSGPPTQVDGNQLYGLMNSLNLDWNNVIRPGTAEFVNNTFRVYSSCDIQYAHSRKRGGRTGLPLGRVKRRQ